MKFGIDISRWQGDYNLKQAKAEGVQFVIIKAGGGDAGLYKDSQFENNYKKAKDLGLEVGCYWFSKAMNTAEAQKEAEYFYNIIKGKQFELPIFFDIENKSQLSIGKRALTDVIHTMCQYFEDKKYYVGIYSSASFFNSYMYDSELMRYDHWVASWGSVKPTHAAMGVWQFGGETNKLRSNKVAGQTTDQDYLYKDYSVIKNNGFNGFGKSGATPVQPKPQTRTVVDLAVDVLNGVYGTGEARKKALGDRYAEVQDLVNKYLEIKGRV